MILIACSIFSASSDAFAAPLEEAQLVAHKIRYYKNHARNIFDPEPWHYMTGWSMTNGFRRGDVWYIISYAGALDHPDPKYPKMECVFEKIGSTKRVTMIDYLNNGVVDVVFAERNPRDNHPVKTDIYNRNVTNPVEGVLASKWQREYDLCLAYVLEQYSWTPKDEWTPDEE